MAANSPPAASNSVADKTGLSIPVINTNDPVENDYYHVMLDDEAAEKDIMGWIDTAEAFAKAGGSASSVSLHLKIQQRLDGIKREYEDFVERHPQHVNARLAFGSFLNDNNDDAGALAQWEAARQLAPTNPATWNNLGNYYAQAGRPVKKAFEYYDKAIELNPSQAVYYHNLAAAVYLFRDDAGEYYHLDGQQVWDKAQASYRQAIKLDPANFILLTDYAESFYGINPPRLKEGLQAWSEALKIAPDEVEKEGVYVHLAGIHLQLGDYDQVRSNLDLITNINYAKFKTDLASNLAKAKKKDEGRRMKDELPDNHP
jgi:tetratricopeptide (TPR) repeat protein